MAPQVTLTLAADSRQVTREFDRVGSAAERMGDRVDKGGAGLGRAARSADAATSGVGMFSRALDGAGRAAVPTAIGVASMLGAVMGPALAVALAGGVVLALGGGVLAAGIIAGAKDPAVGAAYGQLGKRASKALEGFAAPFRAPLIRAADTFGDSIERMAPTINRLGQVFAPLIDKLAPAVAGLAESALPGIADAAERSVPAFGKLAEFLPTIGEWLGTAVMRLGEFAAWGVRNADAIGRVLEVALPLGGVVLGIVAALKVWIAVQTALNVVMALNPIGLVVIAVAALIAIVVVIATKTTWFQDLWSVAWHGIKAGAVAVWDWLKDLPGRIGGAFGRVGDILSRPFRTAFNAIADAWNNTIGRLAWSVPDWIPGIGGRSISAPQLPTFHRGGVVPGAPGTEIVARLQAGERVTPIGGSADRSEIVIRSGGAPIDDLIVEIVRRAVQTRGRGSAGRTLERPI